MSPVFVVAGLQPEIPGATVNRLCGSGMEAVCDAARAIGRRLARAASMCIGAWARASPRSGKPPEPQARGSAKAQRRFAVPA
jgi:acetyl-CoA acetyltransferase